MAETEPRSASTARAQAARRTHQRALAVMLVAIVTAPSCSSTARSRGTGDLDLGRIPSAASYPGLDGAILLRSVHYDVNVTQRNDVYVMHHERVARVVFREVERQAEVEIALAGEEDLEEISARTIQPDGSIVEVRPDEFHTSTGVTFSGIFYSDMRAVRFVFPAAREGSVLDYSFKTREPGFVYQVGWRLQDDAPILRNEFVLTVPVWLVNQQELYGPRWNWNYRVFNHVPLPELTLALPGSTDTRQDKARYSWTLTDVPARVAEPFMPDAQTTAFVRFAPAKWTDWNAFSREYWKDRLASKVDTGTAVSAHAAGVAGTSGSEVERMRRLYDDVRAMRYVAIVLDAGIEPRDPSEVLRTGYGDCKDKAMLLVSMLTSIGIDARPVLLESGGSSLSIPENFPSWAFNHMIVKATSRSGEVYWLDPTATYTPFGDTPWSDEARAVLVINPDGTSSIETIPRITAEFNRTAYDMHVDARTDGNSQVTIDVTYTGQQAQRARNRFSRSNDEELRTFCKGLLAGGFAAARVQTSAVEKLADLEAPLAVRCTYDVAGVLRQQGDTVMIDAMPLRDDLDIAWLAAPTRTYAVEFPYPFTITKRVTVRLVDTPLKVKAAPNPRQAAQPSITYARTSTHRDDTAVTEETLTVKQGTIPATAWPQLTEALELAAQSSAEALILTR